MDRRQLLGATAAAAAAFAAKPNVAHTATRELLVAQPVSSVTYLPMYIAMVNGYFGDSGIEVKTVTIETGGGHTNAVLSGQAFAFLGGAEHCALAKVKGAELRAVASVCNRANLYYCAAKGLEPQGGDIASFVKGKSLATTGYGGTVNSITRYLLKKWGLDVKKDVNLLELANSAILPAVKAKQAQLGCSAEPFITQGVKQSIWNEPFFNCAKEMGPYSYTTINIRLASIKNEPDVVRGFVRGMIKGLKFVYADKNGAAEIAKKMFPTLPLADLTATLNRTYADELWSKDGMVSRESWDADHAVMRGVDVLKKDVKYDEIIDMSFVDSGKT